MHDFTPIPALVGGAIIGLAASLLLLTHGRVAGVSGIFAGAVRGHGGARGVRIAFVVGLIAAGALVRLVAPSAFSSSVEATLPVALAAGVLVGIGTQLGNGCTSGHGVCGTSRLSRRSLVATLTFMTTAILTVFAVKHLFGGMR